MSLFHLIRIELGKALRRGRTYIGPAGLLSIVLPVAIGLKYGPISREMERFIGQGDVTVIGSPVNALFLMRVVMPPTVFFFLPLFICLIAGDQISGESAEGTLRGILSRPVSRSKLILAKFAVSAAYAVFLVGFLGFSAFLVGWLMFGVGGLLNWWEGIRYFGVDEGLRRLILAYGIVAVYQLAVMGIAFLLSVFMSSSLAPVGATLGLMLVLGAVGAVPFFEPVRPFLFTSYGELFFQAFEVPLDIALIWKGIAALSVYVAGCLTISIVAFNRKDILS